MNHQPQLAILLTGGTIDKDYNVLNGQLTFDQAPHFDQWAQQNGLSHHIHQSWFVHTLMLKDSLEMTDDDRHHIGQHITDLVNTQSIERFVLVHGTDTMTQTGQYLADFCQASGLSLTLVITGAMRPIALGHSDGHFNLGHALAATQLLPHGIYISMNGQVWPHQRVQKNRHLGRFEAIKQSM